MEVADLHEAPLPPGRDESWVALIDLGIARPQPHWTLEELRFYLERKKDEGSFCPCCDQYAKRYTRKLNSGMARVLSYLVKAGQPPLAEPWVHRKRFDRHSREVCQLVWWGLAEDRGNINPAKRDSGYWRATERGVDFAYNRFTLPRAAVIYNNAVERFTDDDMISIQDALGDKFDYQELMDRQEP